VEVLLVDIVNILLSKQRKGNKGLIPWD